MLVSSSMSVSRRAFGLSLLSALPAVAANELANRRAPSFQLPDMGGTMRSLSTYLGKTLVVTFAKTSCPHCGAYSRLVDKAKKAYGGQVETITIVLPPDNQQTVANYLISNSITTLVLFDNKYTTTINYLKLQPERGRASVNFPHTFIIDAKGWIREDYGYNPLNKGIFEGTGLYRSLNRYVDRPVSPDS